MYNAYNPRPFRDQSGRQIYLADLLKDGYKLSSNMTRQAGYISRKNNLQGKTPVYIAGRGKRAGQYFILLPSFDSTRYCWRVYLEKGTAGID